MHNNKDMARAVIEGITFALYESIYYLRKMIKIKEMISIGGGAKSDFGFSYKQISLTLKYIN